ncbi:7TM GPCR domain containing protein [Aphelenchoides fujianensis]|nr:7TM GPCR domain containing protein [Aphelenchoides fujianensis]
MSTQNKQKNHASVQAFFAVVYTLIFCLGVIGNGGVVAAVVQNKRLRSARNIFLLNSDSTRCPKSGFFGSVMCRLMPLSTSCAVFVTSWSLTMIAIDKWVHIIDPTREAFSCPLAAFATMLIWLICSLVNIPYLLSFELVDGSYYTAGMKNATPFCGQFCDEINWQGEMRRLYGSTVMLFQFVIPLAIITFCYWKILGKVQKDMIIQNAEFCQSLTSSQRVDAIKRKKRVNFILIAMVAAFLAGWMPLTAVNLARDFKKEPHFMRVQPYLWSLLANAIAMSTVVCNPLLFFWLTRKQKRSNLGGILHTSEILTWLASRVHSLRSTGDSLRLGSTRIKRRPPTSDSEGHNSNSSSVTSRPLIVHDQTAEANGQARHSLAEKTSSLSTNML